MRRIISVYGLLITCAFHLNAQVIDYEIDPTFNSGLLLNRGSVSDILLHDNGNLLITGTFNNWDSPAGTTCLLDVSGNLIISNGNAGTLFKLGHYLNDYIHFGNSGVQRFNLPLQIIPNYDYEWAKPAYSGPLSNKGLDAMVLPDDNILVVGRFFTDSTLMGTDQSHLGLRQLCMIDSTGAPVEGFPMLRCELPVNAVIQTIDALSTGEYIIAGSFNEVGGHSYAKVAKLNADFTVNTDFENAFLAGSGEVFTSLIDSQDRIWAIFGGGVGIANHPGYAARIIRLLSDGSIDESFIAPLCTAYAGGTYENPTTPNAIAASITEDEDGTFILWGDFIEINGEEHRRLAKIDDTGELIAGAFQTTTPDSSVWGSWNGVFGPVMSTSVGVVKKLPDGKLLIGGQFSSFGGEPYSCLVRLQPSGFVGTENTEGRGALKLWPNPIGVNQQFFQVTLPDANERIELVEIYDLQGRVVLKPNVPNQFDNKVDIQNLSPGIYLIKAASAQGIYSHKFVVQ